MKERLRSFVESMSSGLDELISDLMAELREITSGHYVNRFEDVNTVIELMLTEARDATGADGGTFYLAVADNKLRFAYVQNSALFSDNSVRNHYINAEVPINPSSISGYVTLEKKILNIPDIEYIPKDVSYSFNRSFDESSGYRTVSMLTVPVLGAAGVVLAGTDIPLFARITSAADVLEALDALVFPRVYKPSWSFDDAMDELVKNSGTQFDPEVVEAARQIPDILKTIVEMYSN